MDNLEAAANKFGDFINKLQNPSITGIVLYEYGEENIKFCYIINGKEIEKEHYKTDIAGAIGLDVQRMTTEFLDGRTMTYESEYFINEVLEYDYEFTKEQIKEFIEGGLGA